MNSSVARPLITGQYPSCIVYRKRMIFRLINAFESYYNLLGDKTTSKSIKAEVFGMSDSVLNTELEFYGL